MRIQFGTDGWRGVIARDFTFDNVRRVTAAIAAYLEKKGDADSGVAVGYDRRFLSPQFAAEVAGVLAARGIPVRLSPGYLPTPALSWAVKEQGLAGGILITASHNPPEWNGVKFKEPFGGSARVSVNRCIEEVMEREVPAGQDVPCLGLEDARRAGLVQELVWWESYRAGLERLIDFAALRRAGLAVAVDAMHGCCSPWLRRLLEEAGCRVSELHADSNPSFGGRAPEPVEDALGALGGLVAGGGFHLGLANDGDADRIGAVDERGRFFSAHRILAVFFKYLREVKGLGGDAAKTVSATSMMDLLAEQYGLDLVVTPVGFKHIGEVMLERDILVGGEESGGIGVAAHLPERDGLFNALLLAEIVATTGMGLRQYLQRVFDQVGYFTYRRVDLRLDADQTRTARRRMAELEGVDRLAGLPVREVNRLDGTRFLRDDHSWLLVRPSGTEPVLRIYAEARSEDDVQALLAAGRHLAGV